MPVDFQIVFPQEVVKLSSIRPVLGMPVRALDIIGEDFRSVSEVFMNEIPVTDFAVLSKSRMVAQVPDTLSASTITSVTVLSQKLTITEKSFIRFRIGQSPSKVRGILRLVQLFVKVLFQKPGSDITAPKIGGNGMKSLGKTFGRDEGGNIVSDFIISVDTTERQIIQIQGRNHSIPPDERLLAANVLNAGFNRAETALLVTIELLSQSGRSAIARLEL